MHVDGELLDSDYPHGHPQGAGLNRWTLNAEYDRAAGAAPQGAGNYAIENLIGADDPFMVRVIVKGCEKIGGTLIDAEIAGQRTLITYRPELWVARLALRADGLELGAVRIAPLRGR
jgi:hypothetical protein